MSKIIYIKCRINNRFSNQFKDDFSSEKMLKEKVNLYKFSIIAIIYFCNETLN